MTSSKDELQAPRGAEAFSPLPTFVQRSPQVGAEI